MYELKTKSYKRTPIHPNHFQLLTELLDTLNETKRSLTAEPENQHELGTQLLELVEHIDRIGATSSKIPRKLRHALSSIPWNKLVGIQQNIPKTIVFAKVDSIHRKLTKVLDKCIPVLEDVVDQATPLAIVSDTANKLDSLHNSTVEPGKILCEIRPSRPVEGSSPPLVQVLPGDDFVPCVSREVDSWLHRLSLRQQQSLIGRLESPRPEQYMSGYWELFYNQLMVSKSWNVFKDPVVGNFTPDFFVTSGNDCFMLEITGEWPEGYIKLRLVILRELIQRLSELNSSIALTLHVKTWKNWAFDCERILKFIHNWTKSINPIEHKYHCVDLSILGFPAVIAAASRYDAAATNDGSPVFWTTPPTETSKKMREIIRGKANRYKEICRKLPYIIGVCLQDNREIDELNFCRTLYGEFCAEISGFERRVRLQSSHGRFFRPTGHKHVSALIVSARRWRGDRIEHNLRVFHNPWARFPLHQSFFAGHPQLVPEHRETKAPVTLHWSDFDKREVQLIDQHFGT